MSIFLFKQCPAENGRAVSGGFCFFSKIVAAEIFEDYSLKGYCFIGYETNQGGLITTWIMFSIAISLSRGEEFHWFVYLFTTCRSI